MSKEADFLLGTAFTLLGQIRAYLITHEDKIGLSIIESEYQNLAESIERLFYHKTLAERPDGL